MIGKVNQPLDRVNWDSSRFSMHMQSEKEGLSTKQEVGE